MDHRGPRPPRPVPTRVGRLKVIIIMPQVYVWEKRPPPALLFLKIPPPAAVVESVHVSVGGDAVPVASADVGVVAVVGFLSRDDRFRRKCPSAGNDDAEADEAEPENGHADDDLEDEASPAFEGSRHHGVWLGLCRVRRGGLPLEEGRWIGR